ncbi:MAG: hypothetical protein ACTSWA_06230 [Candidatus Thorarchaeota archaeon]
MNFMLIEGEGKVVNHLQKMIQKAEIDLFEYTNGIEKEFATRVLAEVFDISPRRVKGSRTELEKQSHLRQLHDGIMILDTLIENGKLNPYLKIKGGPSIHRNPHSEKHANIAYSTFQTQISKPRTVLLLCRTSSTYRIRIDKYGSPHFGTQENEEAKDEWIARRGHNEDWERYFFTQHDIVDYSDEHNITFIKNYGFDPNLIALIEDHLDGRAMIKQDVWYTSIREEDIIRKMIDDNHRPDHLYNLLNFLTYKPGRNFGVCMYVPLSDCSEYDLVFGKPAVSLTRGSLMEYITHGGTMMTDYGEAFNDYVINCLQTKTSLKMVGHEVGFWKGKQKKRSAQRKKGDKIKIDVLALQGNILYVVSCKAHGFMWDLELESNLMFVPASDFYKRALDNLSDIHEVLAWVAIVRNSPDRLDDIGMKGKQIKPMLITSEREPLQLDKVRDWFHNEVRLVPKCEQYSISDLETSFPITTLKK